MKHILFLQENGIIAILSGAKGVSIEQLQSYVPVGLPFLIVDSSTLPKQEHMSLFRDALVADFDSPGKPDVRLDVEKCKNIVKEIIRAYRKPLYEMNDIVIRDAMISNDKVTLKNAMAERDRLRDLTKAVNNLNTIDKLLQHIENLNIKV